MNSWRWVGALRTSAQLIKLRPDTVQRMGSGRETSSDGESITAQQDAMVGMPVLIGGLHSMLPITLSWLAYQRTHNGLPAPHVVYVMTDEGVLSPAMSRHVSTLRRLGWLHATITYGSTRGGDMEADDQQTALLAARCVLNADLTIVCMGPGISGARSRMHDSAAEAGGFIHAADRLGAVPILIPRISFIDQREQHEGLNRHVLDIVNELSRERCLLPIAASDSEQQNDQLRQQLGLIGLEKQLVVRWIDTIRDEHVAAALSQYPYPISSMGRTFTQDPAFYRSVCAAAQSALELWLGARAH